MCGYFECDQNLKYFATPDPNIRIVIYNAIN